VHLYLQLSLIHKSLCFHRIDGVTARFRYARGS